MPSEDLSLRRFMESVVEVGEQNLRRVQGRGRTGTGGSAPGLGTVANEGVSTATDIARQVAGVALRTAVVFGQQVLEAAGQLEEIVGEPAREPSLSPLRIGGTAAPGPTALMLPPTRAGGTTSGSLDVTNRSENAFDPKSLRCDDLFGTGSRRVRDVAVTFEQVDGNVIPPRGTARVRCTVHVPAGAEPGKYTGLIEAPDHPGVQLLVSLTVE
jgi:hypothetical protein